MDRRNDFFKSVRSSNQQQQQRYICRHVTLLKASKNKRHVVNVCQAFQRKEAQNRANSLDGDIVPGTLRYAVPFFSHPLVISIFPFSHDVSPTICLILLAPVVTNVTDVVLGFPCFGIPFQIRRFQRRNARYCLTRHDSFINELPFVTGDE